MLGSRRSWPSMYSLSTVSAALFPFRRCSFRIGYITSLLLFISPGNWSLIDVPLSSHPAPPIKKCSSFTLMGQGRFPPPSVHSVEGVDFNSLCRKFESGHHKFFDEGLWIIQGALRDSWDDQFVPHTPRLYVEDSFFQMFIFFFELVHQLSLS